MEVWTIRLLGVPRAQRRSGGSSSSAEREIRLRSKKTWAVLASLLLPTRLAAPFASPPDVLSRQTLARRFWGDKPNPRVHLRQALASLKTMFEAECFLADEETIRAAPGAFVTDIDRIREAYGRALCATSPDERLHWLIEAEGEIGGPFLEACLQPGDQGEPWLVGQRAQVHGWVASLLFALADAFEETGNLNGAWASARRAVAFQPHSAEAQSRVWRLAQRTGQEAALPVLEAEDTLEQAVERNAAHLTGKETRLVHALYRAKMSALAPPARKALPRLAVLPAPFCAEVAAQVTGVSRRTLRALARGTPLLVMQQQQQNGQEEFALPPVVRACAWRSVPSATRRQLSQRLASVCTAWLEHARVPPGEPFAPPFATMAQAEPFLRAALRWLLAQPPTPTPIGFIRHLAGLGLLDLAREAVPFLDAVMEGETHPAPERYAAADAAGYILFHRNEFSAAVSRFERALSFMPVGTECEGSDRAPDQAPGRAVNEGNLLFFLGNACHYAGDSRRALTHIAEARKRYEQVPEPARVADCLRFQAEIQNHLGEYEEALHACEEALALRSVLQPRGHLVADALFWSGSTLFVLGRHAQAERCLCEALAIWQDTGNGTGVGFCLRVLGRLRTHEGRYAEARAHIEHALLLHEREGDQGSRLAALEARADVFLQQGRGQEAMPLYAECLADHAAREHHTGITRLENKMRRCRSLGPEPQ